MTYYIRILSITLFSLLMAAEGTPDVKYNGFQSQSISGEKIVQFSNPGFELKQIEKGGSSFIKPTMVNAGTIIDPGEPELPTVTTFYAVEPGKSYSVNITIQESEIIENVNILPLEGYENDLVGTVQKGDVYQQNELFPSSVVTISEPIVMRDMVMVQVGLTPFQYNPVTEELTVIQSAEIELVESGDVEAPFIPNKPSKEFEQFYESLIVNYETLDRNFNEYQRPSILYVLPSNIGNLFGTIEALMDWKEQVGYEVNYVSSSAVVNSTSALKNYIEDAYENWDNPPTHVNLVADASGSYSIPAFNETWSGYNGDTDHPYTTLEGGDQFPEVFIGRLSFSSSSQLQTIVGKTLGYESNPYMNENWFQRACLVGDPTTSGISCVITNEHINEILDIVDYEEVNTVYSGSFSSLMTSGISEGVSFFNYRGYYGVSGFSSSNLNQTSNGFMLPVATVITCGTGSFGYGEALSESFIRAGTATNPKGSVACIGTATTGTHTMFNNIVDMGFYYGALIENIESAGAALMYGKLMLYKNYPSNPSNYCDIFSAWNNLMGESSLQMWSDYPEMTSVSHPYAITKGTNYIDISVATSISSVEEAWVTILMDGEIFESGYTNASGEIRLPIPTTETGEVTVTVTKKNHYPYQSSFQIYDPGVSINLNESTLMISDDNEGSSNGNDNGIANGGETLEIYVSAKNFGTEDATDVVGVLSTSSQSITINSGTVNYGSIGAYETISGDAPFVITLADGMQNGANLGLVANFQDGDGNTFSGVINIQVSGNHLYATAVDVLGSANDVLTPGASSNVKIQLSNIGDTNAASIAGTIACASPFIEIVDPNGSWTSILSGGATYNSTDYFEIFALEETIPGHTAHLIVSVETSDGYTSNSIVEIQVGTPTVYDPVGPDEYGYYIYDNEDIGYVLAPTYNWVEIDDRYGGSGTHLSSLSDNGNNGDDSETVNLPFAFKFYGQEYDQITICSNGWIAMGDSELESFRNYELPGVGGPSSMIAVFWDDLTTTGQGRVYTWYDQVEKKFYVQWSRVRTYQNNSVETFQAVLLDPSYYITPTGDGEILIQFEEFNNTSYGSYSWDQIHGNYCTVGIEDQTMTRGIQYTFNDEYHPAAGELSSGSALLITTRGSDIRMDGDLNYDEVVNIQDVLLLVDFILGHEGQVNPFFADINEDGMVNIMDMVGLIQMVMGYNN